MEKNKKKNNETEIKITENNEKQSNINIDINQISDTPVGERNDKDEDPDTKSDNKSSTPDQNGNTECNDNQQLLDAYKRMHMINISDDSTIKTIIASYSSLSITDNERIKNMRVLPLVDWNTMTIDEFGKNVDPPFVVLDTIPRIFELKTVLNEDQLPDYRTNVILSANMKNDTIKNASLLWNPGTLTTRLYLRPKINNHDITSPNTYDSGVLRVQTILNDPNDITMSVHGAESRLKTMIDIFNAFDGKLYSFPSKQVTRIASLPGVMSTINEMPIFENMYPHFYHSIFTYPDGWYRDALEELFTKAPIVIGDGSSRSVSGVKLYSYIDAVTDQFAAELSRINYNRLRSNQCTNDVLRARYEANSFEDTVVSINTSPTLEILSRYHPSVNERNGYMYFLLISKPEKINIIKTYTYLLEKLNMFTDHDINVTIPWSRLSVPTLNDNSRENVKIALLNAKNISVEKMILMETFSNFFHFDFKVENSASIPMLILNLVSIATYAVTFPNVFQKSIKVLGNLAMICFKNLFPTHFTDFTTKFGYLVTKNGDRIGEVFGEMDEDSLIAGCMYSIFVPIPSYMQKGSQFIKLISQFREICLPKRTQFHLTRKESAEYPYMNTDYESTLSWPPVPDERRYAQMETEWINHVKRIFKFGADLIDFRYGRSTAINTPRNFMMSLMDAMSNNSSSASSLYQYSFSRIEKMLKNSFGFVYDEFIDPNLKPFEFPRPVVMTSKQPGSYYSIEPIHVKNLSIYTPLRILLSTEGFINRQFLQTSEKITSSLTDVRDGLIEGHHLDQLFISGVIKSRKLNLALYITRCLRDKSDSNPLKHFHSEFSDYLIMSNWVPLSKEVFKMFGVDWESYFTSNGLGYDTRDISKTLNRIGRDYIVHEDACPNELFGRDFSEISPHDTDAIKTISKMFFTKDGLSSAIVPKSTGFYLGRFFVDDMLSPNVPFGSWLCYDKDLWKLSKVILPDSAGIVYALNLFKTNGEGDESWDQIILPHVKENIQVILECDWTTDIPMEYVDVLAQAIYEGKIVIKFNKQEVVAENIIDEKNKLRDVSDVVSIEKIKSILRKPARSIIQWDFRSTSYATNFSTNHHVIQTYVQWLTPAQELDSNLFCAALTSGVRSPKCVLPSLKALEYGKTNHHNQNLFSDSSLKIDSNIVNWNNRYPAISGKLFTTDVEINYTMRSNIL